MILTRDLLGLSLRHVCQRHYRMFTRAARAIDMDVSDLSRAWRPDYKKRMSYERMIQVLNKLGYEVHFTIIKKGFES